MAHTTKRNSLVLVPALLTIALAGCGQDPNTAYKTASVEAIAPASSPIAEQSVSSAVAMAESAPAEAGTGSPSAPSTPNTPAGPVMLAYAYSMAIEAPLKAVPTLAKSHEKACLDAGPQVCQVLGSTTQSYGDDSLSAHLSLRAAPVWLTKFRAQIETDTKGADGRVRENNVTSEDLTRAIVDTSAQLNAQKTLRNRLQALLASRPGKLADLLDVERELARVQGQIDSQESELAVMKQRVAMSTLDLNYQSRSLAVSSGVFEPLINAFKSIAGNVIQGLAAMVTIASTLAPWLIILVPGFIFGRRAWRSRQARKALEKAKPPASASIG